MRTSPFAAAGDDVDLSKTGYTVFGGLEVGITKHVIIGGEAQYRGVANAIGDDGVSRDFGEDDLGGVAVRLLVGFKL